MITKNPVQFLSELYQGEHDFSSDTLVACLVDMSSFDPAVHGQYSDVSEYELPSGSGYTQKDKTLTGVGVTISGEEIEVTCVSFGWTATGGNIGPATGCAVINTSHVNETIVAYIDFEAAYMAFDGNPFNLDMSNGLLKAGPFSAEEGGE